MADALKPGSQQLQEGVVFNCERFRLGWFISRQQYDLTSVFLQHVNDSRHLFFCKAESQLIYTIRSTSQGSCWMNQTTGHNHAKLLFHPVKTPFHGWSAPPPRLSWADQPHCPKHRQCHAPCVTIYFHALRSNLYSCAMKRFLSAECHTREMPN